MIEDYYNKTVIIKRKIGSNECNEPLFGPEESMRARVSMKRHMVRDLKGQTVVSEGKVYTEKKLQPDDVVLINGREWPVISVVERTGLDEDEIFYEVVI